MSEIVTIDELRRRRATAHNAAASPRTTTAFNQTNTPHNLQLGAGELLVAAAQRNREPFDRVTDLNSNAEIKVLQSQLRYKFMQFVYADNVAMAKWLYEKDIEQDNKLAQINKLNYWHFPESAYTHFLSPAHLVQSVEMVKFLAGIHVNFHMASSDLRLPAGFIAQYARDREEVLDYLQTRLHVDITKTSRKRAIDIKL